MEEINTTREKPQTHTPGPWSYRTEYWLIATPTPCGYGVVSPNAFVVSVPLEREADARLIAAAPDLLAVVTQLVEAVELLHGPLADAVTNGAVTTAHVVIAKAEGR